MMKRNENRLNHLVMSDVHLREHRCFLEAV